MLTRLKNDETGFTLIELIMVIVILGIISAVAIPKFLSLATSAREAAARGVGSAMSSTISNKHAVYLIDGTQYGANNIVQDTQFSGGIAAAGAAAAPADGTIASAVATNGDTTIMLNYKTKTFQWTYTANVGDTAAYITEAAGSNW